MDEQHRKLTELILYISDRHETDESYGSTRLAKTLFYADFLFYAKRGRSITGERYIRRPNGPMPDSLLNVRDQMVRELDLVVKERDYLGYPQKRPIAIREADLSMFSGEEIAMVDYVLSALEGKSATSVSNLSHRFEAWQLAVDGEEIPFFTALLTDDEPTPEDWELARALAAETQGGAAVPEYVAEAR
jgi:hypothetical protein